LLKQVWDPYVPTTNFGTKSNLMQYKNEFIKYASGHLGMSKFHLKTHLQKQATSPPQFNSFTPSVMEERQLNVIQMDVFSRLMMDRIIFLGVGIDAYVANVIQAQLLFLDSLDSKRDIQMYINSPGGSVIDGLGIFDTMQYVTPDVGTICTSMAASMGAVLLSAGTKGKRVCLPHSRVMIHQPSGGMQGQVSDMEITYDLFKTLQKELYTILSDSTGQTIEQIKIDCDRDNWMRSEEAKAYGLVDQVVGR